MNSLNCKENNAFLVVKSLQPSRVSLNTLELNVINVFTTTLRASVALVMCRLESTAVKNSLYRVRELSIKVIFVTAVQLGGFSKISEACRHISYGSKEIPRVTKFISIRFRDLNFFCNVESTRLEMLLNHHFTVSRYALDSHVCEQMRKSRFPVFTLLVRNGLWQKVQ